MTNTEEHLNEVTINQLTWKPGVFRDVALRIAERVVRDEFVWPDEVDLYGISIEDTNCIGIAWRLLTKSEIITQTGQYRKSTKDGSNSRTVFQYRLLSIARAKTFLTRNEASHIAALIPQQAELPL